jgi:ribosomal-protein-serine acetyltransferase
VLEERERIPRGAATISRSSGTKTRFSNHYRSGSVHCRTRISEDAELRLLLEADVVELHELIEANRAHLAAWLPWAAEQSRADTLGFIRKTRAQLKGNDGFQVAVCVYERIAGVIGFTAVDWEERSTNIGYWLASGHQGRGTMSAAAAALTDHALSVWELRRVSIRVATKNARSRAIPERLGYRQEATLPKAERVGGDDLDLAVYSMAVEDWRSDRWRWRPTGRTTKHKIN